MLQHIIKFPMVETASLFPDTSQIIARGHPIDNELLAFYRLEVWFEMEVEGPKKSRIWRSLYDSITPAIIGGCKINRSGFFDVEERLTRLSGLGV